MGCIQSKRDISDIHPNVFRVINVDESGNGLWTGQLEVTDLELILYRRGRDATKWPLRSLRRYGFDKEIFSFESGRRCNTGQGIYAFKCRRADQLFATLQEYIQIRNMASEALPFSLSSAMIQSGNPNLPATQMSIGPGDVSSPDTTVAPTIQLTHNRAEFLEPAQTMQFPTNNRFISEIRMNSVSSGPISPDVNSPSSPSSANILEVMALNPLPENSANHVSNLYQLQEFPLPREHNNNQKPLLNNLNQHSYCNDVSGDLAMLRSQAHELAAAEQIDDFSINALTLNRIRQTLLPEPPTSPTLSSSSEHYALLSMQEEANRLYMNIGPKKLSHMFQSDGPQELSSAYVPQHSTLIDPGKSADVRDDKNSYANLSIGEANLEAKQLYRHNSKLEQVDDTYIYGPDSPIEETEMNYAVLDIDKKEINRLRDFKSQNRKQVNIPSPKKVPTMNSKHPSTPTNTSLPTAGSASDNAAPNTALGYITIDFDKTVALTSVASGADMDTEGSRKTRHNSTVMATNSPT